MAQRTPSPKFPPLRLPSEKTGDPGAVQIGDTAITGRFPPLRRPDPSIAEPGKVQLGDTAISARFAATR